MNELPTRLARLDTQDLLHLLHLQLTELAHAPHPTHHMLHVLRRYPGKGPQQLLGRSVHARPRLSVLLRADQHGFRRIRLRGLRLEVIEYLCCCVGRGRPDDADARERQREEDQL